MNHNREITRAVRRALLMSTLVASGTSVTVMAQDQDQDQAEEVTTVTVTGTRINVPGIVSSSPIYSVAADEIQFQQQPEVEKILRLLPITSPTDGQNANNGSVGAATINLRGLGAQRNLIMIDGKRATPYDFNGLVDTSIVPTALIERIDIVTGGASAVYGSDAISGALNFILKKDFEGVELNSDFSQTGESDGRISSASLTLGSNVAEGQGNVVLSLNWTERDGVQLGARPLGQLGIDTETGGGFDEFNAGQPPPPPPAGCGGPNAVAVGGSGTGIPTAVLIAGGPNLGQFRDDGSLGSACSVFNFNPYNYYQTPQDRFGGMVLGHFSVNDYAEPYARFAYTNTKVRTQVAPSGIFGSQFFTPLANPFISAQARQTMIDAGNAGVAAGTVVPTTTTDPDAFPNWNDVNVNGVVDVADDLNIQYFRRTVEFGERSTTYDTSAFQMVLGTRGMIVGDWEYDFSFQHGESDRSHISAGYTNTANAANAVNSVDGVTCRTGGASCVPINLFGGFGTITPEMSAYSSASAIEQRSYEQEIVTGSVTGPVEFAQLPWAANPLAVSFGAEYREESAETIPDECLKLAPDSCLGGAGGNILPIAGGFRVNEVFGEAILPLVNDVPFFRSLDLELGYRYSDYNLTGTDDTYKYGLNWRPAEQLLVRGMIQRAMRAPNVGELAAPTVTALRNAVQDPCSVNNAPNIDDTLRARCIATGMSNAQVGSVQDIIVGQIPTFEGTDLNDLPAPETADTTTIGFVWTPQFEALRRPVVSVDYYEIDIADYISIFGAQEVLDGCYVLGQDEECAKVRRIGGGLTLPGSGVELFTTNLDYIRAEGVEVGFSFGWELGNYGNLTFMGNVNKYLTQESQSSATTPVLDCVGRYGTSCLGPLPEVRWVQRTTWDKGPFTASLLWRHFDSVEIEDVQKPNTFDAFETIDSFDYLDLYGSYTLFDKVRISAGVTNLTDEDPPVVGNEAADTRSNSGNTFPSMYDTLGRMYSLGVNVSF